MNFEDEDIVIGYKYYMGLHIVICHAPITEILHLSFGDRFVAARTTKDGPLINSIVNPGTYYLDSPELFGGEKKEGGVQGYVDVLMGASNQPQNTYLQEKLGSAIPAFRGVVSAVFKQCYLTSMTPYIKPMSVTVRRTIAGPYGNSLNDGSASPVGIIYELLTNKRWGMGYPASSIDIATFYAANNTLYSEGLGLSFAMTDQEPIRDTIQMVLNHINGVLYTKPDTGKFAIKLLRNDFGPVSGLPVLDESNIIKLESFERPGYAEMVNEIVLKYRPQGTDKDDSVTVQNIGLIQAQGGIVSETVNYPGLDTASKASRIAQTLLRQKSTPLARVRLVANRKAWNHTIASVVNFKWAAYGIESMPCRILAINYGDLVNGEITVDAIEEVFGISSIDDDYIDPQESGWIDEAINPIPNPYTLVWEAPYLDLVGKLSSSQLSGLDSTSSFIECIAGVPNQYSTDYEFWTAIGTGAYKRATQSTYCPHAQLVFALAGLTTSFQINNFKGSVIPIDLHKYALIGSEIVRIDGLDLDNMTVTVGRGCLDTVPASHPAGTRIYFVDIYKALDITEYSSGQLIKGKSLVNVGGEQLPLAGATEYQVVMTGRAFAPYPPGQVKLNGTSIYTSTTIGVGQQITVSWVHRSRNVTSELLDHTAASVGPEQGTTYKLRFLVNGVLKREVTGVSGTSYTWATESADSGLAAGVYNPAVQVSLESVRDGVSSYQKYVFNVSRPS